MTDRKTDKGMKEAGAAPLTPPVSASMKVRKIGNSLGVILPKDVLTALGAKEGDVLSVSTGADGVTMSVSDEETDRLREMAKEIMERRRKVLRALAK